MPVYTMLLFIIVLGIIFFGTISICLSGLALHAYYCIKDNQVCGRKTMNARKRDILLLVCIAIVAIAAVLFVYLEVPVKLNLEEAKATTYSNVDDFGNKYELIVYNEKDEFANLLVYMPEENDLMWRQESIEGSVELIYTRYENDHYVISFKPGDITDKISTAFALDEVEEKHEHGKEETIEETPLYFIEVSNNGDGSHNYNISCGKMEEHYVPANQ